MTPTKLQSHWVLGNSATGFHATFAINEDCSFAQFPHGFANRGCKLHGCQQLVDSYEKTAGDGRLVIYVSKGNDEVTNIN